MRGYRKKFVCFVLACGLLPAFFLSCNKAALNLERGFWQGLGYNVSVLVANALGVQTQL
jgi:hypothetical protein